MNMSDMKVKEFIDLLETSAPAPGGGSAAGLAAGLGAALCGMVISLTVGKERYKDYEALMQELRPEVTRLKDASLQAIENDVTAFNGVSATYKMPKDTDEEKAARTEAIQAALKNATKAPFELMEISYEAVLLTEKAVGNSNPGAASDLGVAALMLKAAVQSGLLNVLINLSSIKDSEFVAEYNKKCDDILNKMLPLCDKIYEEVLQACK